MKRKVMIVCLLVTLSMSLSISLSGMATAQGAITLKACTAHPKPHTHSLPMVWFKERVEQRSNGRITINWLGGPEVMPPTKLIEAIKGGVIDLFNCPGAYYRSAVPEIGSLLKFVPGTPAEAREMGIYDFWNEFANKKANAFFLGKPQDGTFYLYLGSPGERVKRMADLRGMKLRVSPQYEAFCKALGAVPIQMPGGEIYTALERGVVDGFYWPDTGIKTWKGLIKYRIAQGFYKNESTMLVNLDTWNGIPKEMQKLMIDVVKEIEREIVPVREKGAQEEQREHMAVGMKLVEFPPDDTKAFVDLAYKAAWEEVERDLGADFAARARKVFGY